MIVSAVLGKHVVEAYVIFNDWGFPFLTLMAIPLWSPHNACDQESSDWAQPSEARSCSCRYKWQWLWDSDDPDMQTHVPLLKFPGSPVPKRGRVKISAVFTQELRLSTSYAALKGWHTSWCPAVSFIPLKLSRYEGKETLPNTEYAVTRRTNTSKPLWLQFRRGPDNRKHPSRISFRQGEFPRGQVGGRIPFSQFF